jgi:hypothetical protein
VKYDRLMPSRWARAAKGTLSLSASVALNRRALSSSLIKRASGFAAANGSVPSISIQISRPARRSRTGVDKIWISTSVTLCEGAAVTSLSALSRLRRISIWSALSGKRPAELEGFGVGCGRGSNLLSPAALPLRPRKPVALPTTTILPRLRSSICGGTPESADATDT